MFFQITEAQTDTPADSVHDLRVVTVTDNSAAKSPTPGRVSINPRRVLRGPRVLGEADALRHLTSLPGFSTAGDYGSGVAVGADDPSTTLYTIDGATVFHPFHFGGMFSGFNTSHLASMTVDRIDRAASASPHTGALIAARTSDFIPSATYGSVNIGMLATSASIAMAAGERTAVRLSGRVSHISPIYGRLLDSDDTSIRYAFEDVNLTVLHLPDSINSLKISAYVSHDRLRYGDAGLDMDTRLRWSNIAASASLRHHTSDVDWHQDISYSQYTSGLNTSMTSVLLDLNSGVRQLAAYADASFPAHQLRGGYRVEFDRFEPMCPRLTGAPVTRPDVGALNALLASVSGEKRWRAGALLLSAASIAALSHSDGATHYALDPSLALSGSSGGTWTIKLSHTSQFTHRVGLSDIGFASDFSLPSTRGLMPQRTFGIDLAYRHTPLRHLDVSFNAFAKRVVHSPQYAGSILSLIDDTYDPFAAVTLTDGYNTGGDVGLSLSAGHLSAMAGYGLAVCRRKAGRYWTSSANEPLHSLKLSADYAASPSLRLTAFFTLSSGRPYTPIEAIYIIAGNVVTEYGLLNSARLPAYHRLDLSATYTFGTIRSRSHRLRHFANISMVNAYGHKNVEMQYFVYNDRDHTVKLRRICSLYRFLPSISYTLEF